MFPGVNPSQARQLMKRMGINQKELDATQVIIRLPDKDLVFENPSVSMITMQGQETFQLSGTYEERVPDVYTEVSDADVQAVVDQTQCDTETAKSLLIKHKGDIAAAIMELTEN